MAINFPTFIDKEIVTSEKLNAFVQDIEAKFTAGLGSAEIQWPLVAGGNLVMGEYEVTGGRKIWGAVNAAEYDTFDDALLAAVKTGVGGGVVYIPPNTTIQTDGSEFSNGITAIVGSGPTSILKLTNAPTAGYLLRNAISGTGTRVLISNLVLDGNTEAGTSAGLVLRGVHDAIVHKVWFRNFSGAAMHLTNLTTDGCLGVQVTDCHFDGGADQHILADYVDGIVVSGCRSHNCDTTAFEFVAGEATANMKRISITGNVFTSCDEQSIYVAGYSGTPSAYWESVLIADNVIDGDGTGAFSAIQVGTSGAVVQNFKVSGNVITDSADTAIDIYAYDGHVTDNQALDSGAHGIELHASNNIRVHGNDLADATNVGVVATSAVTCTVYDNYLTGCTTAITYSNDVRQWNNEGAVGVPPANCYYETTAGTLTLPANWLQVGDILEIGGGQSFSSGTGRFSLNFDGNTVVRSYDGVSTSHRVLHCRIFVTGTTTIYYMGMGTTNDADSGGMQGTYTGLDFTSAINITEHHAGLTSSAYSGIYAKANRTELV